MAFFNLAVFFALACSTIIAEPILSKGNDQRVLVTITSKTSVWTGKSEEHLVEKGSSNTTIVVKSQDVAPPHKDVDTAQLYELINEHISSMQAMQQSGNQQLQSVGETEHLEGCVNVTINGRPKPSSFNIAISKTSTLG